MFQKRPRLVFKKVVKGCKFKENLEPINTNKPKTLSNGFKKNKSKRLQPVKRGLKPKEKAPRNAVTKGETIQRKFDKQIALKELGKDIGKNTIADMKKDHLVVQKGGKYGGGRPATKAYFDENDLKRVATLAGIGLYVVDIAATFGLSATVFQNRCNKDPQIYEAMIRGRGEAHKNLARKAYQMAMKGDSKMLMFLLRTQLGWREGSHENALPSISMNVMSQEDKVKKLQQTLSYDQIITLIERERRLKQERKGVIDVETKKDEE